MDEAIQLAWSVRRSTSPNPWVGCVIVPAPPGGPIYEGVTSPPGGPHAEAMALLAAGPASQGATLYTTLEPCSHTGRTPPCADAIIAAGVSRVVVALADPDPLVAGQGLGRLRAAGVDVEVGTKQEAVSEQLAPYIRHRLSGRPWVVLKLAATLDGRSAAPDGTSQWITGPEARRDAHQLRADSDAILVGAGTLRVDDPELTARLDEPVARQPLRVVLGRAPADARARPLLEYQGELGSLLDDLGRRGVLQLLVEGGATVAHAFHAAGLVDRYVVYLAPALFGTDQARALFAGPGGPGMAQLWRGEFVSITRLGPDLKVEMKSS